MNPVSESVLFKQIVAARDEEEKEESYSLFLFIMADFKSTITDYEKAVKAHQRAVDASSYLAPQRRTAAREVRATALDCRDERKKAHRALAGLSLTASPRVYILASLLITVTTRLEEAVRHQRTETLPDWYEHYHQLGEAMQSDLPRLKLSPLNWPVPME